MDSPTEEKEVRRRIISINELRNLCKYDFVYNSIRIITIIMPSAPGRPNYYSLYWLLCAWATSWADTLPARISFVVERMVDQFSKVV